MSFTIAMEPMSHVRTYSLLEELPPIYLELFAEAGRESFYCSLHWFRNLIGTTSRPGDELRLYGLEEDAGSGAGRALALLVARAEAGRTLGLKTRHLSGFSNMYSTFYGPVWRPAEIDPQDVARAFAEAMSAERPRWDVIRFDTLDSELPFHAAFARALGAAGMVVQTYFHFGNSYEDTSAASLEDFLSRRPSVLRNTLKRKGRKLETSGRSRYELFTGESDLAKGIEAYDKVYAASWKQPEPFPAFTPGLILASAEAGALRLGVIYVDDEPAAAQVWIVAGGRATIFKLAYDEKFKRLSAGSVLTERLMRHVVEVDRVREVDFGRGDDPYKSQWLAERRERWGIAAFNRRTPGGCLQAARHLGGRAVKRALLRAFSRGGSGGSQ